MTDQPPDDPNLLAEYERVMNLDPFNFGDRKSRRSHLHDVDWGAVHRLELVPPSRIILPDEPASAMSTMMTRWRDDVLEAHPGHQGDYRAYLFIYPEGEDRFEYDAHQLGNARYVWRDPHLMLMGAINADVASVYRADDMEHKVLHRKWTRHYDVTSRVSRAAHRKWVDSHCIMARVIDPEAPDEPTH